MEKALFSIVCTTCKRRLAVRSAEVIGAILECPKCSSMVQVLPPDDWPPPGQALAQGLSKTPAARAVSATPPPLPEEASRSTEPVPAATAQPASLAAPPIVQSKRESAAGTVDRSTQQAAGDGSQVGRAGAGMAAQAVSPPPLPVRSAWYYWGPMLGAPLAGLVLIVGAWSLFRSPQTMQPGDEVIEQATEPVRVAQPKATVKKPGTAVAEFDRRWLPEQTKLVVSFRPSHMQREANFQRLVSHLDLVWQPSIGAALSTFGLRPEAIRRFTYASTDLGAWPGSGVMVIELEPGHHAKSLGAAGVGVDLTVMSTSCRRCPNAAWPHPFAMVDERTIITGQAEVLRGLPRGNEAALESEPVGRILKGMAPNTDGMFVVDLNAARQAKWPLPTGLLDIWAPARQPWHVIWDMTEGFACTLRSGEGLQGELALVCEGETAAEKVRAAVGELIPAVRQAITSELAAMPARLQAGQISAATAQQYELALKQGGAMAQAARWEIAEGIVWIRLHGGADLTTLGSTGAESSPAIAAAWYAGAQVADEANHQRLASSLGGYRKAEGHYPAGAAGGVLLPPETRLSWIASMLPYLGHTEWYRQLEFGYSWNGPQNRSVTRQAVPEVVNPGLRSAETEAGFPVTHYVGVAGVGPDAGRLKADDPRAGMFGYGRTTRPEQIVDGASNTVALLGVTGRLGPWAGGGEATVRPLTRRPYVNGPDGFGSGQPNGMVASMADGSVRFLSKDTDPKVMEQLVTIHGREGAGPDQVAEAKSPAEVAKPAPQAEAAPTAEARPASAIASEPRTQPNAEPARTARTTKPIDVEARLGETVAEIDLRDMPLGEAIALLTTISTVPIAIDADAIEQLGISTGDPVTVHLTRASMASILDKVASGRGLSVVRESDQVLLTTPPTAREALRSVRYTVSDLTGGDAASSIELGAMVQKLVAPDSWTTNGGQGTLDPQADALVVTQTSAVHHQVMVFCEKLRQARGKPLRSQQAPERFALTSRVSRAQALVSLPVSASFAEATPLGDILAYLHESTKAEILLDRRALADAGMSEQSEAKLKVEKQTLGAALEELLTPLGLGYRAVDAETLQVSTRKALATRLELEFYPVADLVPPGEKPEPLLERIKGQVAGSTWNDAGGPGLLCFDAPSRCLIVLQSQPVQREVERLLKESPQAGGVH